MKKLLLTASLVMLATPALAKEYTIKEISDPAGEKPYYFEPDHLTIQPGDTVTFVDAQEDSHDVMFDVVPKAVTEMMIMGPMQEEEGSKWSYTFTVPGSYHFHCHPHESLGMVGSLIVGEASNPEDMKTVDHEAMEHHMEGMSMGEGHQHMHDMGSMDHGMMKGKEMADSSATAMPEGTGKINSIDAENHTVNVSHDPIAALGWPKMTMELPVAKDVDLSGFKAGDMVDFSMKAGENGQYSVTALKVHSHNH